MFAAVLVCTCGCVAACLVKCPVLTAKLAWWPDLNACQPASQISLATKDVAGLWERVEQGIKSRADEVLLPIVGAASTGCDTKDGGKSMAHMLHAAVGQAHARSRHEREELLARMRATQDALAAQVGSAALRRLYVGHAPR